MQKKITFIVFVISLLVYVLLNIILQPSDDLNGNSIVNLPNLKCMPQENKCSLNIKGTSFSLEMPKNIYYMTPFHMTILMEGKLENYKFYKTVEKIVVTFKMKNMKMAVNQYTLMDKSTHKLLHDKKFKWQIKAILPICVTGRIDWYGILTIVTQKNEYKTRFPVMVSRMK